MLTTAGAVRLTSGAKVRRISACEPGTPGAGVCADAAAPKSSKSLNAGAPDIGLMTRMSACSPRPRAILPPAKRKWGGPERPPHLRRRRSPSPGAFLDSGRGGLGRLGRGLRRRLVAGFVDSPLGLDIPVDQLDHGHRGRVPVAEPGLEPAR